MTSNDISGKKTRRGRSASEFTAVQKDVLARRAAHLCSNPDCNAPTAGPSTEETKAVSIGEAAHVYGAMPGAARYRNDMSDAARRDTANGIWLCRNCHKLIDGDQLGYPAELLFRWRSEHERRCLERLGSKSAIMRFDVLEERYRRLFGDDGLAMQIAREQGEFWEYLLTAELLRHHLKPSARRWRDLKDGLYTRRLEKIPGAESMAWFRMKLDEVQQFIPAVSELYLVRMPQSWGDPGQPGDVEEIAHVCRLIGDIGQGLVRWEEDIAFVRLGDSFEGLRKGLSGAAGHQLDELLKVADTLEDGIKRAEEAAEGEKTVIKHTITFELPADWEENLAREFEQLNERIEIGDIDLD